MQMSAVEKLHKTNQSSIEIQYLRLFSPFPES